MGRWKELIASYKTHYPKLAEEFDSRVRGELAPNWPDLIPDAFPRNPTPSRASSGLVFNPIAKVCKQFVVGTADLSPSVHMAWPGKVDSKYMSPDSFTNQLHLFAVP